MKRRNLQKPLHILVSIFVILTFGMPAFGGLSKNVSAAEENKLQVVGTPTVNVVTGGTADLVIKLKNTTSKTLDNINIWESPAVGTGEDAFTPYTFQDKRRSPEAENAKITASPNSDAKSYGVEPGKTATFHILTEARDLAPGTYTHYLQFADWWTEYDYNEYGWPIWETARTVLGELYSGKIKVTMVIYNPKDAALTVGTSSNYGATMTPFPSSGIDFGSIDLTRSEGLTKEQTFFIKNTSPTKDSYTGKLPDITLVQGTDFIGPSGELYEEPIPFSYYNGYGLYSYDTTLGPDASHRVTVSADAEWLIAGTYTGNVCIETVPHKVRINGREGDNSGSYRIPVTVKLTGVNPRLPKRATALKAKAGNGMVELTWTSPNPDVNYYVYRREGTETKTSPDAWTWADWKRYEKLNFNWISSKEDGTYLYVDGTVENGKTYSYVVTAGDPFKSYASAPATAKPDSSYVSRIMAPEDFSTYDEVGSVTLNWRMADLYGGNKCDGAGLVDHFNIYRDDVLVKQIYQSAVEDEVEMGWIRDEGGDEHFGIRSHSYGWTVNVETPQLGQNYTFTVACVDKNGTEGYRSEPWEGRSLPETAILNGQIVEYHPSCYVEQTGKYVPALAFSVKALEKGSTLEKLKIWRKEGASAPDTGGAPYAESDRDNSYGIGNYDFVDTGIKAGKNYTYSVQGICTDGSKTNLYTFCAVASDAVLLSATDVKWKVVQGKKAVMSWDSDYLYDENGTGRPGGTYKVYRDDQLMKTMTSSGDGGYSYENDPGMDGTYVYRMDKEYKVGTVTYTVRGEEFVFVRNTAPVDEDAFEKPPAAPQLEARVIEGKPVLSWVPGEDGGEPKGFHIYRMDGEEPATGGRMVTTWHWDGPREHNEPWGNARYLTIQDSRVRSFADGFRGNYQNDPKLGSLKELSWEEESCPHVYWITAFNDAGESDRSEKVSFGYAGESESGNPLLPTTPSEEAPSAPVIKNLWADWNDQSDILQKYNEWDRSPYGNVRVSWTDPYETGGAVDAWDIFAEGTASHYVGEFSETVTFAEALNQPELKEGAKNLDRGSLWARSGENSDLGRTVTVTVTAKNSAGEAVSEAKSIPILSFPRSRVLPDNGSVKVEWTDLLYDTETEVNEFEIWRKGEYDIWRKVKTFASGESDSSTVDKYGVKGYVWTDRSVTNGETYQYKIVADCADGTKRPGVVREVTPTTTSATEDPGAPENFRAQIVRGEVLLQWDPPSTGGTPKSYKLVQEVLPSWEEEPTPTWAGTGITVYAPSSSLVWHPDEAGTFRFAVCSFNTINGEDVPKGASSWESRDIDLLYPSHSEILEVTVTEAQIEQQQSGYPAKPVLSAVTGENEVTLNWTLEAEGAKPTFFEVERYLPSGNDPDFPTAIVLANGTSWSYTDRTAEPGVRYLYTVTSRSSASSYSIYSETYAIAEGKRKDEIAAKKVMDRIDELPEASAITVENIETYQSQIRDVQEIYDGLTEKQKRLVDDEHTEKLLACAEQLELIQLKAEYGELVAPVGEQILALPEADAVTLENESDIRDARAAYNKLPADAKKLLKEERKKLEAAEAALRDLKYNLARASVSASGRYMIGGEERPVVTVSMNGSLLAADTEYQVIGYRAQDGSVSAQPSAPGNYYVVIRGRAPYFGQGVSKEAVRVYDVLDDLTNAFVSGPSDITYTGTAVTPPVSVEANGKTLTQGEDFLTGPFWKKSGEAEDDWTAVETADVRDVGEYKTEIHAPEDSIYFGQTEFCFRIIPLSLTDASVEAFVQNGDGSFVGDGEAAFGYAGTEIRPEVLLRHADMQLEAGDGNDYTVRFANNVDIGKAQVVFCGKGNYTGERAVSFTITEPVADPDSTAAYEELLREKEQNVVNAQRALDEATNDTDREAAEGALRDAQQELETLTDVTDEATAEVVIGNYTYTGEAISPAVIIKKTFKGTTYELTAGTHFETEAANGADNTNVGTGRLVIRNKYGKEGEREVSFGINPASIRGAVTALIAPALYTGTVQEVPELSVVFNGKQLSRGTDYEAAMTADVIRAGPASLTITGKGNLNDSVLHVYEIDPAVLTAVYGGETIEYGKEPALMVRVTGFVGGESAESLGAAYQAPVLKAPAVLSGGGRYILTPEGGRAENYTFRYQEGVLNVMALPISRASVSNIRNKTYNGKQQVQNPMVKMQVRGIWVALNAGTDYKLSYKNNRAAGTATMILTGLGNYSGTKAVTFSIAKAGNTLKVKGKKLTVKWKKVKTKSLKLAVSKVIKFTKKGQGKLIFKKVKGDRRITIHKKTGKVTIRKGLKKGMYKVTIKVQALGNRNFKASKAQKVTFKIIVK